MECMVLGKQHMEGKSKAGKDYNFHKVYVSYPCPGVDGKCCRDLFLQATSFPYEDIMIGGVYNAMVDFDGRLVGFEVIDLPSSI